MSDTHQFLIRLFLRPDILAHCQPAQGPGGRPRYLGIEIHLEEGSGRPYYPVLDENPPQEEIVPDALIDEVVSIAWRTSLSPHTPLTPGRYLHNSAVASLRPPAERNDRPRLFVSGPLDAAYELRHLLETRPENFPRPHEAWTDDDAPLALLDGAGASDAPNAEDAVHYKCPGCSAPHRVGAQAPNPTRRRCRACGKPYAFDLKRMRAAQTASAPATSA